MLPLLFPGSDTDTDDEEYYEDAASDWDDYSDDGSDDAADAVLEPTCNDRTKALFYIQRLDHPVYIEEPPSAPADGQQQQHRETLREYITCM